MDIPHSRNYLKSSAVTTAELRATLDGLLRPVEVVVKHRGGARSTGFLEGNLREAVRVETRAYRSAARRRARTVVSDEGVCLVSGGSRSLSMSLDAAETDWYDTGNARADQPNRSWKWNRRHKHRWPRSSCRSWSIAQAIEDMERPPESEAEELLVDVEYESDFEDPTYFVDESFTEGISYVSGDEYIDDGSARSMTQRRFELESFYYDPYYFGHNPYDYMDDPYSDPDPFDERSLGRDDEDDDPYYDWDDHDDFFYPWYGEVDEWAVPISPHWGGSLDRTPDGETEDFTRQPNHSWKWNRCHSWRKFKIA